MADILKQFPAYSFGASPEATSLYGKVAKSLSIAKEKIYITSGVTEGIRVLYESLSKPGENVIVLDPTYPFYSIYAKTYQLEYRKFGFKDDLSVDWDSFYNNIDDETAFVMIPNPNLPIESCFSVSEIRRIADECKKHDAILGIDEAYHYFGAPTILDLVDEYDNLVVMRSFSKAYGLASIRLGFLVSSPDNIAYLSKTRSLVESNTFSMGIAEYMLDHPDIMKKHIQEVKEGSVYVQGELTKLGYRWYGGNVTNGMLIFLKDNDEVNDVLLVMKERKIYVRGAFEGPLDCCLRVSIGPREVMKRFIEVFKEWIAKKKGSGDLTNKTAQ